jgi:hypothetical protein
MNTGRIAVIVCSAMLSFTCLGRGAGPAMSKVESLTYKLASADLSSEKHLLPGYTLWLFAERMDLLRVDERKSWTITTVRKESRFEFIQAEADGLAIRQLPEVIMIGFTPRAVNWRDNLPRTVLDFLRANVKGDWDRVKVDPPKTVGGVLFLESEGGGFSQKVGTIHDSFVAVVVEQKVWVCLPKRGSYESLMGWAFTIDSNKGWFRTAPGQR